VGGEENLIYLQLYWEFFKTGLFSIGGGLATLPFLSHMGESTGWFTQGDLMNMLAVSQSTPGPVGINMATYVGFTVAGIPGALAATIGEVTPCVIIILIIGGFLKQFRDNKWVSQAFYGLRPASTGLITAAWVGVVIETMTKPSAVLAEGWLKFFHWEGIVLALVLLILTNWVKVCKNWHPAVFIALSALAGIVYYQLV
jgi:chromate transporter